MLIMKNNPVRKTNLIANIKNNKASIVFASIMIGVLVVGVIPSSYYLIRLNSEISTIKNQTETALKKIRNLPRLKDKKEEYSEAISRMDSYLYDGVSSPNLMGVVSELASESGLNILSSKPKEYDGEEAMMNNGYYKPSVIYIELKGKYHDLGRFINLLENYEKLFFISDMDIQPFNKDEENLNIKLSILTFLK